MQYLDVSPPDVPSLNEQRDALHKGLGRALQWAMSAHLVDEVLLDACLHDLRYDMQIEDARGNWLWRIIQSVNAKDRFRDAIFMSLQDFSDGRHAQQRCELGFHFAKSGDCEFRKRLYEIVEQKPVPDRQWLAEEQIIQLDGLAGLLSAVRVRGRQLVDRDWEWDDDSAVDGAIKLFGESKVIETLETSGDRFIRKFYELWLQCLVRRRNTTPPSRRDQMRAIRVREVIEAAESERPSVGMFRGWGMHATEPDLESVMEQLWRADEPKVLSNYLRVFSNRPFPRFDQRILELCQHVDDEVRRRAIAALEMNTHPLIRGFALASLRAESGGKSTIGLFVRNYQPNDEDRILHSMKLPQDEWERHAQLMDALKVLEANSQADCSKLAVVVYAYTPCGSCRRDAVRLLRDKNAEPSWLSEECRHDSLEEIRGLVSDAGSYN